MYDFGNISITSDTNIQVYRKKNEAFAFGLHFLPKLCLEIKGFGQNAEEFKLHGIVHSLNKFGIIKFVLNSNFQNKELMENKTSVFGRVFNSTEKL